MTATTSPSAVRTAPAETRDTLAPTPTPTDRPPSGPTTGSATGRTTGAASAPTELGHHELVRYLEDRFACAQACDDCVRACTGRRAPCEPDGAQRLNAACADVCEATSRVLAEQGDQDEQRVRMQVEWCRAVCLQCAALCELHPASARCAEACRRCAKACDDFLTTLG
ncbi:ferredoxin [Streptomyces sp. NPDC047123]|uniref:ferredoxin n=1 Tax=Streptomyces sp. NPDC047123 TaxID=3155622 RepID=UPI0034001DD5